MSGPSVHFSWPTAFTPIPDALPQVLPPPIDERTLRAPFGIETDLFNFALRPDVPIVFVAVYITAVVLLNAYNRSRDHKPWWIARQKPFQWFVVVHNVLLAIFSIATFAAMWRAAAHTWPGLHNPNGAAGIADALCKINGPRGLGDAATYNSTINIWEVKNAAIHLGYDAKPDTSDVGRLWNEGLAFWGWMFYASKFYEALDTLIILAKGKRCATLATYHHVGAILCMWAGLRYMSPPIWMFVLMNSAIQALMYIYFTLSAIGVRVPQSLKRTVTSLQIAHFVFGATFAALHLFIQYDIPVSTPYQVATTVQRAVSSASSAVSSVSSEFSKVAASPTATATLGALIKKLLLRAAGEEGVAERVHDRRTGKLTSPHMEEKIQHFNEQTWETKYRTDYTKVNCIDTTGQAFAIYLNLLYLAPLAFLFARFFVRAYTQRGKPKSASQAAKQITSSEQEAERRTTEAIEASGKRIEDELRKHGPEAAEKVRQETNDLHEQLREDVKRMKDGTFRGDRRVSDRVASFERQVKTTAQKAVDKGKEMVNGNGSPRRSGSPSKGDRDGVKEEDDSAIDDDESEKDGEQQGKDRPDFKDEASQPQQDGSESTQKDKTSRSQQGEPAQSQKPSESQESKPSSSKESKPSDSRESKPSDSKQGKSDIHDSTPTDAKKDKSSDSQDGKPSDAKKGKPSDSQKGKPAKLEKDKPSESQKPKSSDSQKYNPSGSRNASPSKSGKDKLLGSRNASPSKSGKGKPTGSQSDKSSDSQRPQSSDSQKDKPTGSQRPKSSDSQKDKPSGSQKNTSSSQQKPNNEAKENQPPLGSGANNQSEQTQDENMADSKLVREGGAQGQDGGDKGAGGKSSSDRTTGNQKPGDAGHKEKQGSRSLGSGTNNEPEQKQDENMADSQALRPGAGEEKPQGEDEGGDEDPDAMGKSGSIIDLTKERARDARKEAEGSKDLFDGKNPAAGAEEDGSPWKPPGATQHS
ncbi:hypothetical protein LTR36_006230 [Oleoguttula mirabilis]|uniref:Elongation of fatty acids protein n=1 Tax=Oleoguttula mirabilis TaxID=1507867 RepID=A0AAV9JC89_9PEZI|nr:hypothetical protein LTR36_006230 [Oleoguttula mirabilis]